MAIVEPLLDEGRVLFTDNFYTSASLAHELLNWNTDLVSSTLIKNRKIIPKEAVFKKLKKDEIIA